MASSQFRKVGNELIASAGYSVSGTVSDSGPYEAIIVGHIEGSRMGQLLVSVPDWGGVQTDIGSGEIDAIPASYASPFYGTTFGTDTQQNPDTPATSGQSYGMWMVPPDVGCKVLITFVAGDMSRCYWFACVYDSSSHHMVPGIARHIGGSDKTLNPADAITKYLTSDSVLPVVEYDTAATTAFSADGLEQTMRYPHEVQTMNLVRQGLDRDAVRGAISSSSLRESPSNVYGISTPGRKATKTDQVAGAPQVVFFRKGGHQFVMDDGAEDGTDQLVRLRTSGGHQILMNDTEDILYIASNTGNQWMEFSPDGSINMYGIAGINMRSKGPMNFHSDSTISMNAMNIKLNGTMGVGITSMGTFSASALVSASVKSDGMATLSSLGKVSVTAGVKLDVSSLGDTNIVGGALLRLNSGSPGIPFPALPAIPNTLPDVSFNGQTWVASDIVNSICTVVPTHEPWTRPEKKS
jgi:hypothetical protein